VTSSDRQAFGPGDALIAIFLVILILTGLSSLLPRNALVVAGVAFPLAAVMVAVLRDRSLASILAPGKMTAGHFGWSILGSAGMLAVIFGLVETLLKALPRDYKPELDDMARFLLNLPTVVAFLVTVVMAPICEEVFFRGAVLRGIRSSWGTAAGLLLSSALFGAWHQLPPRMIVTFVLGLWFGWLAVASGGLAAPVVAHAFNNAVAMALLLARVDRIPSWAVVPGGLAVVLAAWRIRRSMQGSEPSTPS
jgi:CAAX protease family protein